MSQYFPKPYEPFRGAINVKVDFSNYARKTDSKNISHIDISSYALKPNLASLKIEVDKLDIDKLTSVPIDLAKLSNVVKKDVVKKTEYDKLVNKVNGIDNTNFVSRTKYEKDGSDFEDKIDKIEKKIPDIIDLVKKSALTAVENKIPDINGLATKSALTAVENKIPNVSALVKKTDYDTKISNIEKKITDHSHGKYITTPEFNTMTATVFNVRLAGQTDLIKKPDFDAKLKAISDRVTKNKSKDILLDNELKKLKTFDADYFEGKNYFEGDDGMQRTLVFQVKSIYFGHETISTIRYSTWKSKGISNQSLYYTKSAITPKLMRPTYVVLGTDKYFFQDSSKVIANNSIVNIYIVYKLSPKTINTDNALKNCLFGTIKADKPNTDPDKYIYSGYRIGFDHTGEFTHPEGNLARNMIIFGGDMSRSAHASNKTQNILVLGKAFIRQINNTAIYAKKMYAPNFSVENILILHYNGDNSYLFVNGQNVTQYKAKNSEIGTNTIFLGTLGILDLSPKDVNGIKLYGNIYDFSVDYSSISNENILKIHKYL